MKNCVFTICAKNYIGLADVLKSSIKKFNPDLDFRIIVADEFENEKLEFKRDDDLIVAKNNLSISEKLWDELTFKYNLTEFCTAIKPYCFDYLFKECNYQNIIYFDPDILVFENIEYIFNKLKSYHVIVTPHVIDFNVSNQNSISDSDLLNTGIFNLGFIAMRNTVKVGFLLEWWSNRLKDKCFIDYSEGYYTDQKWMNLLPCYLSSEELYISNELGFNLAPWNFSERLIVCKKDNFFVQNRRRNSDLEKLYFVHFSGFNYPNLIEYKISNNNIIDLNIYEDLKPIFNVYIKYLQESQFLDYLKLSYSYSTFKNGVPISEIYRQLYRRLSADNFITTSPFVTEGNSFYNLLVKRKLLNNSKIKFDKIHISNVTNLDRKLKIINLFSKVFLILIGPDKYFLLVKFLKSYSKIQNHVHLIDSSYCNKNILNSKESLKP